MKPTFLKNDRIFLRAVEPEDLDVMYEMENDPAMWDVSSFTEHVLHNHSEKTAVCF